MPRKARMWARCTDIATAVASGAIARTDMLSDYKAEVGVSEVRGVTVGGLHLEVGFLDSAAHSATSIHRVGISIAPLAQGLATGVPRPGVDSFPWMWYWEPQLKPWVNELSSGVFEVFPVYRYIQIRAMRKLTMGEDLVLSVNNLGAHSVTILVTGNILLLR